MMTTTATPTQNDFLVVVMTRLSPNS